MYLVKIYDEEDNLYFEAEVHRGEAAYLAETIGWLDDPTEDDGGE